MCRLDYLLVIGQTFALLTAATVSQTAVEHNALSKSAELNHSPSATVAAATVPVTINITTTTTPTPTPYLPPFVVADNITGTTCLLANFTATVKVSWNCTWNSSTAHREFVFNKKTVHQDGRSVCSWKTNESFLGLEHIVEPGNNLLLTFANTSTKQFGLANVTLNVMLDALHYPGLESRLLGSRPIVASNLKLWQTSLRSYYQCLTSSDTVPFTISNVSDKELKIEVKFEAVKVQALMTPEDHGMFGKETLCHFDRVTNEIVPIVVGCALAALVIIVLVAYLIGRRRSRAQGYESM